MLILLGELSFLIDHVAGPEAKTAEQKAEEEQAGSRLNSASTKGGKADLSTATTPDINTASATKKTTAANVTCKCPHPIYPCFSSVNASVVIVLFMLLLLS